MERNEMILYLALGVSFVALLAVAILPLVPEGDPGPFTDSSVVLEAAEHWEETNAQGPVEGSRRDLVQQVALGAGTVFAATLTVATAVLHLRARGRIKA